VFYNAAMAVDRDLGVSLARALRERGEGPWRAWEMLAATGVRGLRILSESDLVGEMWLTEQNPEALPVLRRNARRYAARGAHVLSHDAHRLIPGAPFDFVDLDPYGTPVPFLPTALEAVRPGGLLGVTATDMMVLAGVLKGTCEARYGARPLRGRFGPEGGLRILIAYVARLAAESGRRVRPILSYVHDHHVRAYLRVTEPGDDDPVDPVGLLSEPWDGPAVVGGPFGPMWLGPLFDRDLVGRLGTSPMAARPKDLERLLRGFRGEVRADRPLFYEPNELAALLHLSNPPGIEALLDRLESSGWSAGRSHVRDAAFRTTAPRVDVLLAAKAVSEGQAQKPRVRA
jgi:tRNA (guanine26-N2/guanine27-N2)-dimethyltransferase